MGMLSGFLCLLCFYLLAAKALTRRFSLQRAGNILNRLHKPLCAALAVLCPFHFIFVLSVFSTRSLFVLATGVSAILFLVLIVGICHITRHGFAKWQLWHRRLSLITLLFIVGHVAAVSGAANSSNVIQKAVQNALERSTPGRQ